MVSGTEKISGAVTAPSVGISSGRQERDIHSHAAESRSQRETIAKEVETAALVALSQVDETLEQCFGKGRNSAPEKTVILLGNTGVGKTTLVHALAGKALKVCSDPATKRTILQASQEMKGFTIGNSCQSQTSSPRMCLCEDVSRRGEKVAFVDFPGLNDTRGTAQEISNAICMQGIFEASHGTQIIALVDDETLMATRPKTFLTFVSALDELFLRKSDSIASSVSLVVTQADGGRTVDHVRNNVTRIIKELHVTGSQKTLLQSLCEKVSLFKRPADASSGTYDTSGIVKDVFDKVRANQYLQAGAVGCCLSDEAKSKVLIAYSALVDDINRKSRTLMETCVSQVKTYIERQVQSSSHQEAVNALSRVLAKLDVVGGDNPDQIGTILSKCEEISSACNETLSREDLEVIRKKVRLVQIMNRLIDEKERLSFNIHSYLRTTISDAMTVISEGKERIKRVIAREAEELEERRQQMYRQALLEQALESRRRRRNPGFWDIVQAGVVNGFLKWLEKRDDQ